MLAIARTSPIRDPLVEMPRIIINRCLLDNRYNKSYTFFMKTAISIPDKLFKHAEETASKLGISRSRLFSLAIKEFLRFHSEVNVTRSLDEIYEHEPSTVDDQLQQMQAQSIAKEEW